MYGRRHAVGLGALYWSARYGRRVRGAARRRDRLTDERQRRSSRGIFCDHRKQEPVELGRNSRPERARPRGLFTEMCRDQLRDVVRLERDTAANQLVGHAAERIDIGPLIYTLALALLG